MLLTLIHAVFNQADQTNADTMSDIFRKTKSAGAKSPMRTTKEKKEKYRPS